MERLVAEQPTGFEVIVAHGTLRLAPIGTLGAQAGSDEGWGELVAEREIASCASPRFRPWSESL